MRFTALSPLLGAVAVLASTHQLEERQSDPCVTLSTLTWTTPSTVLACYNALAFNTTIRDNIVDVAKKTLAFHSSSSYQWSAPFPYTDIHVDIQGELTAIRSKTYTSDYALHVDVSNQVNKLLDGHTVYLNLCYDGLFVTYLPFPLVVTVEPATSWLQDVRIAPEAYQVLLAEFGQTLVQDWETRAGYGFAQYNGAKVIAINNKYPFEVAELASLTAGTYQARSTRINGYFASYMPASNGWQYRMGDFAMLALPPTTNTIQLTIQPNGSSNTITITVPYMSRFGSTSIPFTNKQTFWERNCLVRNGINGVNYWGSNGVTNGVMNRFAKRQSIPPPVLVDPTPPRFSPEIPTADRRYQISSVIEKSNVENIALPGYLIPSLAPAYSVGSAKFYRSGKLGILVLSSFSAGIAYNEWFNVLKNGIQTLKDGGATHLIVDVTNNSGGYVCVANYLHRLLAGPKATTQPQAGLDTKARYSPLASAITGTIINGGVPWRGYLLYDPIRWKNSAHTTFSDTTNWLEPPVTTTINGMQDKFSQKLGEECGGGNWPTAPPSTAPFPMSNIVILGNGRCASSCALFSVLMAKKEGVRTAVMSGRMYNNEQYAGIVGGQSSSFAALDSEIKSTGWKNHPLAPPDFLTSSFQGVTWRLAYGVGTEQPEEWQDHTANFTFQVSSTNVSNPLAIWRDIAPRIWSGIQLT